ncbi:MAG TPA: type II and III secretion system protein [Terriglobia bacterium]|nr:type II and III secretion system protein [Terriglobia bacterium]
MLLIAALLGASLPGAFPQSSQEPEAAAALAASQPVELQPAVERASFRLRRPDLRGLYDAIARSYGIRLLYDQDLGAAPVSGDFVLEEATLREALEAAASISRTFVAPLDPHTGIVAADTPAKRSEYERQVLGSFHLDSQLTAQQLTEISNALRTIVDLRRVTQDARTNWITVLGRTRQVEAARQFVESLDKPTGEVLVEIDVWELDLRKARQIGVSPPQPFVLQFLGTGSERPSIPLLHWGQVQTLYGLQIPTVTAFLNSSDSLVRSHQTLRLRATDGQPARLLVGNRVPVVTTTVSAAILPEQDGKDGSATEGFIPGIQYQDVGVVVNATPHLHSNGELTLELDVALRSLGAANENGMPTFSNRQITTSVRLGSNQAYLLGGIFSRSRSSKTTGYPWFSRLPILGLLFGARQPEEDDTELLMMVRPTVVRRPAAEEFASRSIYFGKELVGLPAPAAVPAPPPVSLPGLPPGAAPPPGAIPLPGQPQPEAAPDTGQPVQPGMVPGPGQLPQGVPFPPGAVPQGIGIQPGVAPTPAQPQPGQPQQSSPTPQPPTP